MRLSPSECWERLATCERGVLCTVNRQQTADAVPVCFAAMGLTVVSPVDRIKPKETGDLARVSNVRRTGTATLLCDQWDADDWTRLWWVRAHLVLRADSRSERAAGEAALRQKYHQYREAEFAHVMAFDVQRLLGWSAAGSG
jgi:PPOX class probable F420-dependent enzyme